MTRKEGHQASHRGSSPEGCRTLARDNIPGQCTIMIPRPGGVPDERKLKQGMQPKSTLDLGCAVSQRLCFSAVKKLFENKGKPGENRLEPAKKTYNPTGLRFTLSLSLRLGAFA